MRIALLAEGGYPYALGEGGAWCDRLVRGLPGHAFDVYALSRSRSTEARGWAGLPSQVRQVRTQRLWGAPPDAPPTGGRGRAACRARRRDFLVHYRELAAALAGGAVDAGADRFASAVHGLAELALHHGGLPSLLRSEHALRALETACHAPGVRPLLNGAGARDLLTAAELLEQALRPLSAPWYEPDALGSADLCHAVSARAAVLPGLLAKRFFGTPLLITEYGVRLRETLLAQRAAGLSAQVRALLTAYHRLLSNEAYRQAAAITSGTAHARHWQEHCGAERSRTRTVHPGIEADRFAPAGEAAEAVGVAGASGASSGTGHADPTLAWVGRVDPAKDLIALLHAFAEVRREEPGARLRILYAHGSRAGGPHPGGDRGGDAAAAADAYLGHCRTLAAQLFPDEAADALTVGENPVSFEEIGSPGAPRLADAYAAGDVVVLSSVVEGFPLTLVEAMFCGRATVSTDVGAVREVIGGTGLVVPPRNPKALAAACLALLRDPERSARLGAAARERALELFTVERCVDAFGRMYPDLVAQCPPRRPPLPDAAGAPRPFDRPPECHVPVRRPADSRAAAHLAWRSAAAEPVRSAAPPPAYEPLGRCHVPVWAVERARAAAVPSGGGPR